MITVKFPFSALRMTIFLLELSLDSAINSSLERLYLGNLGGFENFRAILPKFFSFMNMKVVGIGFNITKILFK